MAPTVETTTPTSVTNNSAMSGGTVTGDAGMYNTLVDLLIKEISRDLAVSRQKITATIKCTDVLELFQMFEDSKQADKKFLLTGFRMDVLKDMYDIELTEYDNTTEVNLV